MTTEISEQETARMSALGITSETVQVYSYKQYKYQKLSDALKYAERDALSDKPDPPARV